MAIPLNVLVVEDRLSDAELMIHELKRSGFEPRWARVETEADYLARLLESWDVILSDYHMPQFDARRALHLLKERDAELPFLVVTGTVGEEVAVAMMREGAADYLLKDRLARLGEAVRHAVEDHRQRQRQREAEMALAQEQVRTERQAAELEAVMDAVPAIVFIAHDPDCRLITGNRSARELLGLSRGANVSKTAPPDERPERYKAIKGGREIPPEQLPAQQAAQGREVRDREVDLVFVDGTVRTIFGNAVPLWDELGRPRGAVGAFIDITERKQAEELLRQGERRFRQVVESLPQLVWTCHPDGNCDYLSPQWVAYTGIPAEVQLGFRWVEQLHPDDRQRTVELWRIAAKQGTVFKSEFRLRRHDGVHRWFHTVANPLRDETGQIVKWFGTNTDVEERKQAEEALRRTTERLSLAQQAGRVGVFDWDLVAKKIF